MNKLITFILAILFATQINATDPGLKIGVNQAALDYLTETILPVVLTELQKVEIESVSTEVGTPIGTVDFNVTDLKIASLDAGTISVAIASPHTIKATMSGGLASASMGWSYRQHIWPHTSDAGTGTITAKKVSATITLDISTNKTDGRPIISTSKVKFKIGKLKVKLHGGASWLYNLFIGVLKPFIISSIDKSIRKELKYLLNTFVNEQLAAMPVQIPLGLGMGIAYAFTADPSVTAEGSMVFPSQAEFYPLALGPGQSGHEVGTLPDHATSKVNMFEFVISEYTMKTLAFSAYKAGAFEQRLTKEDAAGIPGTSVLFTTDVYVVYAPRMLTKYGHGKEVSLRFSSFAEPLVSFTESGFQATFPLILYVDVNTTDKSTNQSVWEEAFSVEAICYTNGTLGFDNNTFFGKIIISNTTIGLHSSNVGAVNVKGLSSTIHLALEVGQTFVNNILADGVPVPSFQGLTFVDPTLEWFNGYVGVSTSGKYVVPNVPEHKH